MPETESFPITREKMSILSTSNVIYRMSYLRRTLYSEITFLMISLSYRNVILNANYEVYLEKCIEYIRWNNLWKN